MIFTTTNSVEGHEIETYLGIAFGDAIVGVNVVRDMFAAVRDVVGGRSGSYEKELRHARDTALSALMDQAKAMAADAVIGIDIDYEAIGTGGKLLMVTAIGTAVKLRRRAGPDMPDQPSPWAAPRR